MPKTRTPAEAILYLRNAPGVNKLSDAGFAAEAADTALSMMWKAYPWDDSLVSLPPMYMTPNESMIEPPQRVVPSDFWYLERAWVNRIPNDIRPLHVLHTLLPSTWEGMPTSISYEAQFDAFRLYPTPGEGWGAPDNQVEGTYKKQTTQITTANVNSLVLPFHDHHFSVYRAALKWAAMDLLGSREAGTIQVTSRGNHVYTGALGQFFSALQRATAQELNRADEQVRPAEGIMLGG